MIKADGVKIYNSKEVSVTRSRSTIVKDMTVLRYAKARGEWDRVKIYNSKEQNPTFSSFWCFFWGHKGYKPPYTVRYGAHLILSLCDTIQIMAFSMASESTLLSLTGLAGLLKFFQPEQNFLSHLLMIMWSTILLPFIQQFFLLASMDI